MSTVHYTYMHSLVRGEDLPLDNTRNAIIVERKRHLLTQEQHQASLSELICMIKNKNSITDLSLYYVLFKVLRLI